MSRPLLSLRKREEISYVIMFNNNNESGMSEKIIPRKTKKLKI